ncbi:MAG: hypothetical protein ACKVXR_16985 [Planctomycetota bacterium]
MSFHFTSRTGLEAVAGGLLLLAGCTHREEIAPTADPRPQVCPAAEPLPTSAPAAEPLPRDSCLACGMGYVPAIGKLFLDAYSAQKS